MSSPDSTPDAPPFQHLQELLAPAPLQSFLDERWGLRPLHVRAERPERFSALFSLQELDRVLGFAFTDEDIELLENGTRIALGTRREDKTTLPGFYEHFRRGRAILVREAHIRCKPIAVLANALARELGVIVTGDVLVAPPRARELPAPRPSGASLILQVSGTSTWRSAPGVDDPAVALPPAALAAGDVLYLPRVSAHVAEVADQPAVCVVFSLQIKTWADLLLKAVEVASERNIELRRAVGFGAPLCPPAPHMQTHFHELAGAALRGISLEAVRTALSCEQKDDMPAIPDGHFAQMRHVDGIDGESLVERRLGAVGELRFVGDEVEFFFPGNYQRGPEKLFLAMEFMKEQPRFRVKDIPGWYTESEKILIVQHLIRRGFLRLASGA